MYRAWSDLLSSDIEACAIQLPGRETRFHERPSAELEPLIRDLQSALRPALDRPAAFFGHSLGAVVAFELMRQMRGSGDPVPDLFIASGRRAPHLPSRLAPIHSLPRKEFLQKVQERYRAIPQAVMAEPELLDLLLPTLQADMTMAERHTYELEATPPLRARVVAFGGKTDPFADVSGLEAWRELTSGEFELEMFDGGHFFLNEPRPRSLLVASVERALERLLA